MKKYAVLAITLLSGFCCFAQPIQGTVPSGTTLSQATSNYYYARPNELTIIVSIVGFVQRPGRYEISNSIDLINLMALAGGATPDGTMDDVKLIRLVEMDGRVRLKEFSINLEETSRLLPTDLVLRQGDLIEVSRSGWASFRDTFGVVVSAAIITTAVAEVIIASKR